MRIESKILNYQNYSKVGGIIHTLCLLLYRHLPHRGLGVDVPLVVVFMIMKEIGAHDVELGVIAKCGDILIEYVIEGSIVVLATYKVSHFFQM